MSKLIQDIKIPANSPKITVDDINNGPILYDGQYCDVVEVVKGDDVYAVKCIYKQRIQKQYYNKQIKQISNQISILYRCKHQNIITLLGHFQNNQMIALIFQKFGKNLQTFINIKSKKEGSPYTLEIFIKIFRQIGEAIKQLHCLGYVHRDISPQNILMNKQYSIKLIDFGCASPIWGRKTKTGTIQYMAPEILQSRTYNHKIDIWAFGILCFEMLYGKYPFRPKKNNLEDEDLEKEYIKLMMQPIQQFSEDQLIITQKPNNQITDTIKCFLNFNPEKRPEIGAVLSKQIFGAKQQDSRNYQVQVLRFKTQRKTSKLPANLNLNTNQMSINQLQNTLFTLVSMHSNQIMRKKQLLEHLINSEKKLAQLRIQKYSK